MKNMWPWYQTFGCNHLMDCQKYYTKIMQIVLL